MNTITAEYSQEESKLKIYANYDQHVLIYLIFIDLNTNLTITGGWVAIGKEQVYCDFSFHHNFGFIVKGYINEELVLEQIFQQKEEDKRFKFSSNEKEFTYAFWSSLAIENEYKNNKIEFFNDDVLYDLGANIGVYSMWALYHNIKQAYAFEPTPSNIKYLNQTFKQHKNIEIFEKAISNEKKLKKFYLHPHSVCNSFNYPTQNYIEIECINLEQFIQENNLLFPTIIKCDIEGEEYDFINSLSNEFLEPIRLIILEFHLNHENKIYEIVSKLLNIGFSIQMANGGLITNEAATIIAKKEK